MDFLEKLESGCYDNIRSSSWTERADANDEAKQDMLVDVGLDGHPKAERAYEMANERGRHSGFAEIYKELVELADLLLDD